MVNFMELNIGEIGFLNFNYASYHLYESNYRRDFN